MLKVGGYRRADGFLRYRVLSRAFQNEATVTSDAAAILPSDVLAELGQAAFVWDIPRDTMELTANAADLLRALPLEALAHGASFGALIEPSPGLREDAIRKAAAGPTCVYRIFYSVRASTTHEPLCIEEQGVCECGEDGRPLRVRGLVRLDHDRRAREDELLRMSQVDALTGELNRAPLIAELRREIDDSSRVRGSLCFLLVGIDHLSGINDAFGFDVADAVIREVACRVRVRLRGGDVLGRFSGNKLGVILKNCSADDCEIACERFLAAIRDEVIATSSGPVAVTATIGVVMAPRHARTVDEALNRAQEALAGAKKRRRGSVLIWRPNVERDAQRRLNIRVTDEIVTALNERRIETAFEPVVDATTRRPKFFECLARMRQDDGRLMLAPDVVPVAERLGLIRLLDHRMLELVIDELSAQPGVSLSLNISPETTRDPDWWAAIDAMMRAQPHVGPRLIVEITETVAIQDVDDVRGFVTRLKKFGSRIAIDDFGAGFTSFRNLRKLGVDIVKIDGDFVKNITTSADDRAFVRSLIDLARRLEIETVAEWVQDEGAAGLLRDWGCNYIQGRLTGLASDERPWIEPAAAAVLR
jgi:diguanylate cyclase (GGDEF)-like protein